MELGWLGLSIDKSDFGNFFGLTHWHIDIVLAKNDFRLKNLIFNHISLNKKADFLRERKKIAVYIGNTTGRREECLVESYTSRWQIKTLSMDYTGTIIDKLYINELWYLFWYEEIDW